MQIYEQIIEATDNPQVIAVITDIINEEKLHAGQFLSVLFEIAPEEKTPYESAKKENEELEQKKGVGDATSI